MIKVLRQNLLIIVLLVAVIATGAVLMVVSQNVYEKQSSIRDKGRDLVEQEWELRTLKAEWAYLSRPDRLDELSSAMGRGEAVAAIMPVHRQSEVSLGDNQDQVNLVSLSVPTPSNKPFYMIRSTPAVSYKDAQPVKTKSVEPKGDFSSLLKTIGGAP